MKSSNKKKLALVLGLAIAANTATSVVFADDVTGVQEIQCGTTSTLTVQPATNINFTPQDVSFASVDSPSTQSPSITIADTSTDCRATATRLQVDLQNDFFNATSGILRTAGILPAEPQVYSTLAVRKPTAGTTAPGTQNYADTVAISPVSYTNISIPATVRTPATGAVTGGTTVYTAFSDANGFAGSVTIPGLEYQLTIPPVVTPGTYQATVTYTLLTN